MKYLPLLLLLVGLPAARAAEPALPICDAPPAVQEGAPRLFEAQPLMLVAHLLESQGEADFRLKYAAPQAECALDAFVVGDAEVAVSYNPWVKGPSTLVYRWRVLRAGQRSELLLLYHGLAGALGGTGPLFLLSETRADGVIAWYAMYGHEPGPAELRAQVQSIVAGRAEPLLAVRWPAGAKEGEILAYDAVRLKP